MKFFIKNHMNKKCIIDTCVWIALFHENDSTHSRALEVTREYYGSNVWIPDFVFGETLSVLRRKADPEKCQNFVKFLDQVGVEMVLTQQDYYKKALRYFFQFKGLSFFDCLLLVCAMDNKSNLLTFDRELEKAWGLIKSSK